MKHMDIEKLLQVVSATKRIDRSHYHLTLGSLIEALKNTPGDHLVEFSSGWSPGNPHSYRGYYSDLSFGPQLQPVTVYEFLSACQGALGATFEGYKGGDFVMEADTPLWGAFYGERGPAIVGLDKMEDRIRLILKQIDD